MAFADLLRKAIPATSTDPAARLAADLTASQSRADAAHIAWAEATADEQAAGGTDTSRSDALDEDLSRALREVNKLEKALEAVQARKETSAAAAARAELETKWTQAGVLAAERCAAAVKFKRSLEAASRDYQAFIQLGSDLTAVLPEAPDLDAAMLRSTDVEIAVKKEMLRVGFDFVFSWPYGKVSLPNFLEPFEATAQLVRQWRDSAMARR